LIEGAVPRAEVTIAELCSIFRREVAPGLSGKYRSERLRELELWTRFLGPNFPVSRIGIREWNTFVRVRTSGEIDARGVRIPTEVRRPAGPRTVAKSLKALRQLCRFAESYRRRNGSFLLQADPTRGLALPVESNPKRPVSDDERFERLLAVADSVTTRQGGHSVPSYLKDLIILAGETGRRIGSIVALRHSDWLPERGTYGTLNWRADADKLRKDWFAPVTPLTRATMEEIAGKRPSVGNAWLFPAPKSDGHVRVDVASRWLLKAEKLADLEHEPGGGWHAFRRMWATKRKHLPLQDVAAVGGWKDGNTLQKVYQHPDPETMEAVATGGRTLRLHRR
jgi:integrase